MQIFVVVAPVFATNCCVVAAGATGTDADCVIVDAGAGTAPEVERLVAERRLTPRAVIATHGHVDHTWDAATLCETYDVPLRLHAADVYRLADPFGTLGLDAGSPGVSSALTQALAATGRAPEDYRAPAAVEPFGTTAGAAPDDVPDDVPDDRRDEEAELVAGEVRLRTLHAPGHTEGSTLLVADDVVLAGDVLFASGVGRTDLPGGDAATMARTLREVVARLDPAFGVVPGHGPTTTVGRELETNPYLR